MLVASLVASDSKKKKKSTCNAGNPGLIPRSEGSPREGGWLSNSVFLLGDSMDRGDWWSIVLGVAKSWT